MNYRVSHNNTIQSLTEMERSKSNKCDRLRKRAHLAQVINFYFIALLERAHFVLSNAL